MSSRYSAPIEYASVPPPSSRFVSDAQLINAAFDTEQGKGIVLAQKYQVNAYPTLLFIDANGKIVTKTVGYYKPKQLIKLGNQVIASKP